MTDGAPMADVERLRRERDLYRRLLALGGEEALEPLLERALTALVDVAAAEQAYLEIRDPDDDGVAFRLSRGCTDTEVDRVRSVISRGIIARALESGETVITASAQLDPRFRLSESVRENRISSVLCAPVGGDPPLGVVYLQGRRAGGAFTDEDRECVELVATTLASLAARLLRPTTVPAVDPTAVHRARLKADALVGRSAALAAVLEEASHAAALDVSVVLTGPSGTGKSILARAIHASSPRASGPFREVNCAAIPADLVESELFGVQQGAHSTAHRAREGLVRSAHGGSLLLDEIGELPLAAQAKLLHLLQEKQFFPLGSDAPVTVDVRILAASNRDLRRAVKEGRFRGDLFFRLWVVPLRLPSLAERREDIPLLAEHIRAAACRRHGLPNLVFTREAVRSLQSAEWPGNIRELGNIVERAAINAAGAGRQRMRREDLFPAERAGTGEDVRLPTFTEATRRFQTDLLHDRLAEAGWNVTEAARALGISRSHLYGLMETLGMRRSPEAED